MRAKRGHSPDDSAKAERSIASYSAAARCASGRSAGMRWTFSAGTGTRSSIASRAMRKLLSG